MDFDSNVPTKTYEVQWWAVQGGWKAQTTEEGITVFGQSQEDMTARLRRGLTRKLLGLDEGGTKHPQETKPADFTTVITPEPANPLSLSVRSYVHQHGGPQVITDQSGINRTTLIRMMDPFYWSHSTSIIRRLVNTTGHPLSITVHPGKQEQADEEQEDTCKKS